jgi:titin
VACVATVLIGVSSGLVLPAATGMLASAGATTPTTVTQTFGFDNDTLQNFTVPSGVTSLTITAMGGQGSWGGADSSGRPPSGGYQGEVTGTMSVTAGEYLTIAVGSGGDESIDPACTGGQDASTPTDINDAVAGISPLTEYDGGMGGAPGPNGCSGYGGSGGAATAVELGSSSSAPTSVGTVVAAGGGGSGGSGQYALVKGQISLASYVPQSTPTAVTYGIPAGCTTSCTSHPTIESPTPLSTQSTQGQQGIAVFTQCGGSTGSNSNQYFNANAPSGEPGCDGGGGAGGGGGASGGAAGNDQFGSGSSDEWYGQGGSPGQNSTGGISGLSGSYPFYSDSNEGAPTSTNTFKDPGSAYDGSVVITYSTGVPGIPTALSGAAGNTSVALQWTAPSAGAAAISDYIVQYSSNGGSTWSTDDTGSTATSATVTGLTNGTGYIFEVEAVNSYGDGPFSTPTGTLTPNGPPGSPTITSITPQDGGLQVNFTAPSSGAPITGYLYQLNGTGPWYSSSATSSPIPISGLTDGTSYSVEIEAVSGIGTGTSSNAMSQTPVAVPGAPTITSVQVGSTTASIAFTPGSDGGSTITGYRYSTDGGSTWTSTSTTSPVSVTGLSPDSSHVFELEAINVSGDGAAATTSFTTSAPPSAPVIASITPGNQSLRVNFTAPASNGSPIIDYDWSTDGGSSWYSETSAGTPCQVSGGTSVACSIGYLSLDGSTNLTNGTSYPIEMRAVNGVGAGGASMSYAGTPYTTPGAPTITTGSGGMVAASQALTVAFSAPTTTGGSAITSYQYSTDAGATWHGRTDGQAATSTTMTISALSSDGITPLTNGSTYDVEIRAVNAAGDGPGSAVATGIPVTVPGGPTITSVTSENGALGVDFAPASNGGSAVTVYEYSVNGGVWTSTGSLSPTFTIGNLTNGTSYAVEVRADNVEGDSNSSPAVSAIPATVPGQPVITATDRGNATISITYSEPSTGGSAIVTYQYSTDAGVTWQTAPSNADPMVITTLSTNGTTSIANGTQYPVEIRAVNAVGDSLASSPVEAAPATVPGAPGVIVTPGNGSITVTASVTNNGGSSITGVDYSLNGGPFVSTGTTSSTFTIAGLVNGTSYSVSVRADNAIGDGTASSPASATPRTVPGAPIDVVAVSDSASADVSWTAPVTNGGSAVTGYTATAYTSSAGTTSVGTACSTTSLACTVTGLVNGTTYYIGVVATNAAGSGISSTPLQAVMPIARPGAPSLTSIASGDSYLAVSFTAGAAGGDPITSYQYSLDGGTTWIVASGTTSPIYINGLTDGTSYPVMLRAVSAAGPGASSSSLAGTPYTYPDAPSASSITANGENGSAVVTWAAPDYNGGAAISNQTVNGVSDSAYTVTAFSAPTAGNQIASCTTSGALTCTLNGLTNGTTYYISIQAGNAAGLSQRSTPRVAVTPSIDPGAVTAVTAVAGEGSASLSWTPGSSGQSAVTNYTIWYSSGGSYTQFPQSASTATTATVTGLTNGTAYTFEVYAVNAQGTGPASSPSNSVTPVGPSISSPALTGGEVGVPYHGTPSAAGGTGTYTWSVTGGSLPGGLTLNTSTGAVTGTPTASGSSTFTLLVTDSDSQDATQSESVVVVADPSIAATAFAGGETGVSYTGTPVVSGGTAPFTWSVTGGTLPVGLTLNTSTGAVTGTPTSSGMSTFTLTVSDADGQVTSRGESVLVAEVPAINSAALVNGEVGVPYGITPTERFGTAPFVWSVTGGPLPTGLTLNASTGAVTGTPTAGGTFHFTLTVTDSGSESATQIESVTVAAAPTAMGGGTLDGDVGVAIGDQLSTHGGTGPYIWTVASGSMPPGVVLSPTGTISGVPADPGTFTVDVMVTDSWGRASAEHVTLVVVPTSLNSRRMASTPDGGGYWIATTNGSVSAFGDAHSYGSMAAEHLNQPIVGIAATPDGAGYWLVASDGGVFAFGDARYLGSEGGHHLNLPVVGMATTPDGAGYWLVASDGGVFTFGDAGFFGSTGSRHLNQPVVGMAATPDGVGYWLVASDGGVFTFGDAGFFGSTGSRHLNQPVVGMAATPDGHGYWLVASDGGVFTFGDAPFDGSEAGHRLNSPVDSIEATQSGQGYWLVAGDGGVFTFGGAAFMGSLPESLVRSF